MKYTCNAILIGRNPIMKFNKAIVAMILAIVMVMGLASAAMAEDALKIGVIGPFTGAAAIYGNACKYGAQVAAEQINAQGGLQIELLNEDDEHDPEKSINAFNTVLDNGAQMIAGTTTTTPCIAVGKEANSERVFMLTPSASSPDVTADKDNVFHTSRRTRWARRSPSSTTTPTPIPPASTRPSWRRPRFRALRLFPRRPSPTIPLTFPCRFPTRRTPERIWFSCPSTTPPLP